MGGSDDRPVSIAWISGVSSSKHSSNESKPDCDPKTEYHGVHACAGSSQGPDYRHGWGLMDAQAAVTLMDDAADPTVTDVFILEDEECGGVLTLDGTPGSLLDPIKVTLVWTDVPGAANTAGTDDRTPALMNDLDLLVVAPNGLHYYPWTLDPATPGFNASQSQPNRVDNVEQVQVSMGNVRTNSGPFPWQVTVQLNNNRHCWNASTCTQPYTLIVENLNVVQTSSSCPAPGTPPGANDGRGWLRTIIDAILGILPGMPLSPDLFTMSLEPGDQPPFEFNWSPERGGANQLGLSLSGFDLQFNLEPSGPEELSPLTVESFAATLLPFADRIGVKHD